MNQKEMIQDIVNTLSETIGCRPLGSAANARAVTYTARLLEAQGCLVTRQSFEVKGWEPTDSSLLINGVPVDHLVNPYSPDFSAEGTALRVESIEQLEGLAIRDRILLLTGEAAAETIMPKHFEFYNPAHHQRLTALLEGGGPSLVIAVRDQELPDNVTGVYGKSVLEPVFNDGDLNVPSVTVTKEALARWTDSGPLQISAWSEAQTPLRKSCNVVAYVGDPALPQVLVTAHLDTFFNTPGAMDDATGIAFLAALAGSGIRPEGYCIKLVAINGEDHYTYSGEKELMKALQDGGPPVLLAVNVDGLGFHGTEAGVSLYEVPDRLRRLLEKSIAKTQGVSLMAPWPQGDHMIFSMMGIPTIALASDPFETYLRECHHSPADTADRMDAAIVERAVQWLKTILEAGLTAE